MFPLQSVPCSHDTFLLLLFNMQCGKTFQLQNSKLMCIDLWECFLHTIFQGTSACYSALLWNLCPSLSSYADTAFLYNSSFRSQFHYSSFRLYKLYWSLAPFEIGKGILDDSFEVYSPIFKCLAWVSKKTRMESVWAQKGSLCVHVTG